MKLIEAKLPFSGYCTLWSDMNLCGSGLWGSHNQKILKLFEHLTFWPNDKRSGSVSRRPAPSSGYVMPSLSR